MIAVFDEPWLVVARCNPFGFNNKPCKLEFHNLVGKMPDPAAGGVARFAGAAMAAAASVTGAPLQTIVLDVTPPKSRAGGSGKTTKKKVKKNTKKKMYGKNGQTKEPLNTGTLISAIRIPTGVGNIMWSKSILAHPEKHFSISFIGTVSTAEREQECDRAKESETGSEKPRVHSCLASYDLQMVHAQTPENKERSQLTRGDPEDRIFVLREPFVETRYEKSRDLIEFVWEGEHLVGPRQMFGGGESGGSGNGKGNGETNGKENGGTGGGQGGGTGGTNKAKKGRRLLLDDDDMDDDVQGAMYDDHLGTSSALTLPGDGSPHGRQLQQVTQKNGDTCVSGTIRSLMTPYTKQVVEVSFTVPIYPGLAVGGAFELDLIVELGLRGEVCIKARKVTLTLVPTLSVVMTGKLFLEVAKIMRGGLYVEATVLKIGLEPTLAIAMRGGFSVGGKLELVVYPPRICIGAFVDVFLPKLCGIIPCGFEWTTLMKWQFICFRANPPASATPPMSHVQPPRWSDTVRNGSKRACCRRTVVADEDHSYVRVGQWRLGHDASGCGHGEARAAQSDDGQSYHLRIHRGGIGDPRDWPETYATAPALRLEATISARACTLRIRN